MHPNERAFFCVCGVLLTCVEWGSGSESKSNVLSFYTDRWESDSILRDPMESESGSEPGSGIGIGIWIGIGISESESEYRDRESESGSGSESGIGIWNLESGIVVRNWERGFTRLLPRNTN